MTIKQLLKTTKHKLNVSSVVLKNIWANNAYIHTSALPDNKLATFTNVSLLNVAKMSGVSLACLVKQAAISNKSIDLITQALKEFNTAYTNALTEDLQQTKELNSGNSSTES